MQLGWPMMESRDKRDLVDGRLVVGGLEVSIEDLLRLQSHVQRRELEGYDWTLARAVLKEHADELQAQQARRRKRRSLSRRRRRSRGS